MDVSRCFTWALNIWTRVLVIKASLSVLYISNKLCAITIQALQNWAVFIVSEIKHPSEKLKEKHTDTDMFIFRN